MLREREWSRDRYVPSMDEYMENAYVSFAIGPIVLPTLYLVGPELSDMAAQSSEVNKLFKLMSNCGRLLNDIQGFKVGFSFFIMLCFCIKFISAIG